MNSLTVVRAAAVVALLLAIAASPTNAQSQTAAQPAAAGAPMVGTRLAVIDIDRVAAESSSGRVLFESLKQENDRLAAERAKREQEIRDLQTKAASEAVSPDARERLQRDIQRKQTDAQRWLEDAQREFQEKQQQGEAEFQKKLAPIVEQVAKQNGIQLILRATAGLTFVLDPSLDITPLVIEALNKVEAAKPGEAPKPDEPGRLRN